MQPAQVYVNAWAAVKKLVGKCFEHGIGVLLDMHAAPGGANSDSHSGTSSGKAELWGSEFNLNLLTRCLCFVAQEVIDSDMKGVVGIELINEARWDPPGMYKFYDEALMKIAAIDHTLPIYISDGWNLSRALKYALSKNNVKREALNPVIVDTHKYYTFAEKHTSCSPEELIGKVSTELTQLDGSSGNVFDNQGRHHAAILWRTATDLGSRGFGCFHRGIQLHAFTSDMEQGLRRRAPRANQAIRTSSKCKMAVESMR